MNTEYSSPDLSWLDPIMLGDTPAWASAPVSTLPHFLNLYTLGDSTWDGLFSRPNKESVLVLQWDSYWANHNQEKPRIAFKGECVDSCYLFIRIERLWNMEANFATGGERYPSEGVSHATSELLTDMHLPYPAYHLRNSAEGQVEKDRDAPIYCTVFEQLYSSSLKFWHGGETRFLCYTKNGKWIYLPGI